MKKRLVFGLGYLGERVARYWLEQGDLVSVVTRSTQRAEYLGEAGYQPMMQDLAEPWQLGPLGEWDTVLIAVGYDRSSDHSLREVYVGGIEKAIKHLGQVDRLVYVSTTGVYGDASGDVVDEESESCPQREGGICSLEAEQSLLRSHLKDSVVVLRSAGIYGPGRLPNLQAIRDGEAIRTAPDNWLNLVHVDDLANIVLWAAESRLKHQIYNVSDGSPVQRRAYYGYLGELASVDDVKFASETTNSGKDRANASKRVDSGRLRREYKSAFLFPSFREGLSAAFSSVED